MTEEVRALLLFLIDHPKILLLMLGYYLFANVASALPKPSEVAALLTGRPVAVLVYKTVFHIMQGFAGNLARIIPGLRLGPDANGVSKDTKV